MKAHHLYPRRIFYRDEGRVARLDPWRKFRQRHKLPPVLAALIQDAFVTRAFGDAIFPALRFEPRGGS